MRRGRGRQRTVFEEDEDLLDLLEVEGIGVEKVGVLFLKVGLDDVALQQPLEAVQQLETPEHCHAIVEGLRDHRGQPALQLVDLKQSNTIAVTEADLMETLRQSFSYLAAEVIEVVVKLLGVNIHDVVLGFLKHANGA